MKLCPLCGNPISDHKFERHLALHRAPAPALAGPAALGVTRYACPNHCVITGSEPPARCKHGKPPMLAWRNFRTGAVDYYPPVEYRVDFDYWTIISIMAGKRAIQCASH